MISLGIFLLLMLPTLQQAQQDILVVNRLYPEMGGTKWYGKFDELLKKIQRLRDVQDTGLKALEKKSASSQARALIFFWIL